MYIYKNGTQITMEQRYNWDQAMHHGRIEQWSIQIQQSTKNKDIVQNSVVKQQINT